MKTIVYIAHPNSAQSGSQQFLLSSGQMLTDVTFVDLHAEFEANGGFEPRAEQARLAQYQRIIVQFPLYWYQAPAILKQWMDTVFDMSASMRKLQQHLAQCEFGVVPIVGVAESEYQAGGREQRTMSELLSPYETFARYFGMRYLAPFAVYQFQYMSEEEKFDLMLRYACYLQTGTVANFLAFQDFIIDKIRSLTDKQLDLSPEDAILFELFAGDLEQQRDELDELLNITRDW